MPNFKPNAKIEVKGNAIEITFEDGSGVKLIADERLPTRKVTCETFHHNRKFHVGSDVTAMTIVDVLKDMAQ